MLLFKTLMTGKCEVLIKSHVSTCKHFMVSGIIILLCNDRHKIYQSYNKKRSDRVLLLTLFNNM